MAPSRHRQRGDEKADRHASAVAEEDLRGARQVPRQEPRASAGKAERKPGQHRLTVNRREDPDPDGRDAPNGGAGPVEVVHQIECVHESDDPDDAQNEVDCAAAACLPSEPDHDHGDRRDCLREQPPDGRDRDPVVDRPDQPQTQGTADRDQQTPARRAHRDRRGEKADKHRRAAQQGRCPRVLAVATGPIVEVGSASDRDRQRRPAERCGSSGRKSHGR